MARGLPFTYGPSRTAPKSSTARAMGVFRHNPNYNNTTNQGGLKSVEKRYSDFVSLRESLVKNFPNLKGNLPGFPEKKVVGKTTFLWYTTKNEKCAVCISSIIDPGLVKLRVYFGYTQILFYTYR